MNKVVAKLEKIKCLKSLRCGKFSDLNSACSKMLVHVKIFQFQDMLNENERYCEATKDLFKSFFSLHYPFYNMFVYL